MQLHQVVIAFHEAGSTENLDLMLSLFADDAVMTAKGQNLYRQRSDQELLASASRVSAANSMGGLRAGVPHSLRWMATAPIFECLWVDKTAGKLAAHTNSDDTLARINGRWLIKQIKAEAVPDL